MNLGQLVDKVYQACGADCAETARIEDMLNDAQDEVARRVKAPTQEVRIQNVAGAFLVRNSAGEEISDYNGILEVHAHTSAEAGGYRVRLLTTSEASRYFPNWRLWLSGDSYPTYQGDYSRVKFVIYDPVNVSAKLVPIPLGKPTDLYVKVHLKPNRMVEFGDEPLNGEMANSHKALWHYVAFELFNERGDERGAQLGQMHYNFYKSLLDEMVSDSRQEPVFVEREQAAFNGGWSDWGDW